MSALWTGLIDFWQFDFLRSALLTTVLLSIMYGLVSPLVIAKRYAFLGSAVSHSTLLGLSIALALFPAIEGIESNMTFPTTLLITFILTMGLGALAYHKRVPADSMIGLFYTTTMGLGIIIHSITNKSGDLMGFLFGNIMLLDGKDVLHAALLLAVGAPAILGLFNRWQFVASDEQGAELSGLSVRSYHFGLLALLTVLIVASVRIAGPVAADSWIIAPGIAGLRLGKDLRSTYLWSVIYAVCMSVIGLWVSNSYDLPPGATLCVANFLGLVPLLIKRKS
jgi:ABC-type Mn2+/Zn2+ transport system permease subunit